MRNYDMLGSMDEDDLREELVGKTIASIDLQEQTIHLTDGTELRFIDTADCCAWFNSQLMVRNLTSNAITNVTKEYSSHKGAPEAWTLHVLAEDKTIVDVDIWGDSTTGYYCRSIDLKVVYPE
ncbi:Uncharacterised protein [Corynebacterium imitans]|uniref:DUF7448 domain-containing protein n=1 Tax=Corynebacterium imitans TaxID=156978 RepID=A0A076NMM9_9CORY|nr:hypothetical protein [Corynebacterium imitans]AIJ33446.1 hypothetical protein CIMIT_05605 [Corynebacterium imitans]SNV70470.1 Uncharacterised protein [Corynebacterium imitans]